MLEHITVAYFSPTGGTCRAACALAKGLAENVREIDLSTPDTGRFAFEESEVVLVAGPVFGGRLPAFMVSKLKGLTGNAARAVTAVVYGNRAYEDALLELNDCLKEQGFRVAASAALVAEHSMAHAVAAGRPDEQDQKQLGVFAADILRKLESGDAAVSVPGNHPYREWQPMPVVPVASGECVSCGQCAEKCPTQAIPKENPKTTDPQKCMLCLRCVCICPRHARALPAQVQGMLEQKLSPLQAVRRENELFL